MGWTRVPWVPGRLTEMHGLFTPKHRESEIARSSRLLLARQTWVHCETITPLAVVPIHHHHQLLGRKRCPVVRARHKAAQGEVVERAQERALCLRGPSFRVLGETVHVPKGPHQTPKRPSPSCHALPGTASNKSSTSSSSKDKHGSAVTIAMRATTISRSIGCANHSCPLSKTIVQCSLHPPK